jgi:hypothetical protein
LRGLRRAVIKASDERYFMVRPAPVNQHDKKQAHDANDDAEYPQPNWWTGVGRRIGQADTSRRI